MSTVYEQRPLYAAVTTRLVGQTGKPVGQGEAPDVPPPYPVLYPWPDVATEGSLSDPYQIAIARFQVSCVGGSMEEVQWMQHKVRAALVGWVHDGFPVELEEGSGVMRDDALTGGLWVTTDRFQVWQSGSEESSST